MKNVIEPAQSEWEALIVLALKRDGTLQLCMDYCKLDTVTILGSFLILHMDECIDCSGDATIFLTMHAISGYWKVEVTGEEATKPLCVPLWTILFITMQLGLKRRTWDVSTRDRHHTLHIDVQVCTGLSR